MPSAGLGRYQTRINQIAFGGLFLFVVFMVVRSMALSGGGAANFQVLVALVFCAIVVLLLDKHYWLLLPLGYSSVPYPMKLPSIPFEISELICIVFLTTFFVRLALKKDRQVKLNPIVFTAFPFFFWVCFVWMLNPVGMNIFGSETIGGRSYFKVLLAFATMLAAAKVHVERGMVNHLFTLFWLGIVAYIIRSTYMYFFGMRGSFDLSGTKYFLEMSSALFILMLARYDFHRIVFSIWKAGLALLLLVLTFYSGRRTYTGQVLISPILISFAIRGREKLLTCVLAFVACLGLAFLIAGHGGLWTLPYSAQRAFSFLPGKWDARLENYGMNDDFRDEMIYRAKQHIRESPIIGRGGFAIDFSEIFWVNRALNVSDTMSGHEVAGNWHNKFYGMSADFGLPAGFAWYLFAISAGLFCLINRHYTQGNGPLQALLIYFTLLMFFDLIFAFGGSATTPYRQWQRFGVYLMLLNCAKDSSMDDFESPHLG